MKEKTNILVIGGGPAGIVAAVTARKYYPEKKISVMKSVFNGCIPCGIPYMFNSLTNPDDNKLGNASLDNNNIKVILDEAVDIDRNDKKVITKSNSEYGYDKLILATGSNPIDLNIKGINLDGVYPLYKDMDYLKPVVDKVKESKKVLIVGGGFIGIEFADEISKNQDVQVTLVEVMPDILSKSFDLKFSKLAEEKLKSNNVQLLNNTALEEIIGDKSVEKVRFSDSSELDIDSVILGIGSKPDILLAEKCGLDVDLNKGICVDEYMRTSDPDIYAVGDCVRKMDFYTHKPVSVMLASTATSEARIAGANLYGLKVVRENKGTIAVYSTYLSGLVLGSAGLIEAKAKEEGFEIIVGEVNGIDKHPGKMPGANSINIKLIFSKYSGILLGGQVAGGMSCSELINLIGIAIQKRMSINELETLQVATHPYLTSAPTVYPIILAAQNASIKNQ